jgi:hypothetical protein
VKLLRSASGRLSRGLLFHFGLDEIVASAKDSPALRDLLPRNDAGNDEVNTGESEGGALDARRVNMQMCRSGLGGTGNANESKIWVMSSFCSLKKIDLKEVRKFVI